MARLITSAALALALSAPAFAQEGQWSAADEYYDPVEMDEARRQLQHEGGGTRHLFLQADRLEYQSNDGAPLLVWDAQGWYGGDLNRIWVKTEGEHSLAEDSIEGFEVEALYSRAIGPFFDLQAGVRFDPEPDSRTHLVLGVAGLAPYMFHVDGALFLSDRGDLTARIEAEYDQKITQRLILQPRIEAEFAAQDIPERETGAGFTGIEPGLRLRYEIVPEFAPYIGVEYEAKLGETADIARARGADPDGFKAVIGLRTWF